MCYADVVLIWYYLLRTPVIKLTGVFCYDDPAASLNAYPVRFHMIEQRWMADLKAVCCLFDGIVFTESSGNQISDGDIFRFRAVDQSVGLLLFHSFTFRGIILKYIIYYTQKGRIIQDV